MSNDLAKISFDLFGKSDIQHFLTPRDGETKIGQEIATWDSAKWKSAKYVIIGVEESVGPRANRGRGGAEHAFKAFLSKFLNMQSNSFFEAKNVAILGRVKVDSEEDTLIDSVESLDLFINQTITDHLKKGQFPILIGGGHNNALPLIKYLSTLHDNRINVVNLDAHADYRLLEGRHSGNSFSYAFDQGWMNYYEVFGLHYQYNSQQIFDDLKRDGHSYTLHESYINGERNYFEDFKKYLKNSNVNIPLGVELDLDSIERMPSSAFTPVGVTMNEALRYLRTMAKHSKVGYLHLPEGAPNNDDEYIVVGKTLAYLVTDFIRAHCNAGKLY
jgi:formiminoglutamase